MLRPLQEWARPCWRAPLLARPLVGAPPCWRPLAGPAVWGALRAKPEVFHHGRAMERVLSGTHRGGPSWRWELPGAYKSLIDKKVYHLIYALSGMCPKRYR